MYAYTSLFTLSLSAAGELIASVEGEASAIAYVDSADVGDTVRAINLD